MNLFWKRVVTFFNTPIRHYDFSGEEIVDKSPRVPMLQSVIIILIGAVIITVLVFAGFAVVSK